MKKMMMIIAVMSLSFFLSDLSFAKNKHKHNRRHGIVGTAVEGTSNIVRTTGNAAANTLNAL